MILWPISIMMVLHKSVILGVDGARTNDFRPVYLAAWRFLHDFPVYAENYDTVDPHYLYPPGGTLLLAPFGFLPEFASRNWFIAINTVAIIVAACLLVRLFGFRLSSVALPALLLWFFCGLTFGSVQIGAAVMLLGSDDDEPRGGTRIPVAIPVRARHR